MSRKNEVTQDSNPNADIPTRSIREGIRHGLPEGNPYPFLRPAVQPDELGRLGEYRVLRLLGAGGMGMVFLAEDIALCRPVALKVMKPDLDQSNSAWDRFLREARIMAAIKHDNLVTVYQVGQDEGVIFLAMELLEGESLESWIERIGRAEAADVVRIGQEVALGLAAIHQRGLIHRDIKPANIWLETRGQGSGDRGQERLAPGALTPDPSLAPFHRVKILDFGLARGIDDTSITRSGMIVGTPAYMSPARGKALDSRSDLFSLGGVLYTLCTGRDPFKAENTMAQLAALVADRPADVRTLNPEIPEPLADLVMELLAKEPDERSASAEAVLTRLKKIKKLVGNRRRRPVRDTAVLDQRKIDKPLKKRTQKRRRPARLPWVVGLSVLGTLGLVALVFVVVHLFLPPPPQPPAPPHNGPPNGRAAAKTYLSDMKPSLAVNWPFSPPPKDKGPRPEELFAKLAVMGEPTPHGIFMHPAKPEQGAASLTYHLGKKFNTFHARVGFNHTAHSEAPVTFTVSLDGELKWKSRPMIDLKDWQSCTVPVAGVDSLKLEVTIDGKGHGAHAVWAEPYVD